MFAVGGGVEEVTAVGAEVVAGGMASVVVVTWTLAVVVTAVGAEVVAVEMASVVVVT